MSNSKIRILTNTVIAVLVVGLGVFVARSFIANKEEPQKKPPENKGTLVEVIAVEDESHPVRITGRGSVLPAREVGIKPQVTGRVVSLHPQLKKGGTVAEGDVLFQIEKDDYQIAVQNARAAVDQAEAALALEMGRVEVAERELELFKGEKLGSVEGLDDESLGLARREPQVKSAEAQIRSARNQLRKARLDLSRTTVKAPFDARVLTESIEVGDVVGPGAPVATLYGADELWVQVNVPTEQVGLLKIPGVNGEEGSMAWIRQNLGEGEVAKKGRVLRLLGDLDPVGRLARVIVAIDDPFADGVPLFLDSYVDVELEGRSSVRGFEIPRLALRDGNKIWVMTDEGNLDIREAVIAWRTDDSVVLSAGIDTGERLVVSRLGTPIQGMKLRTEEKATASSGEARTEERAESSDE